MADCSGAITYEAFTLFVAELGARYGLSPTADGMYLAPEEARRRAAHSARALGHAPPALLLLQSGMAPGPQGQGSSLRGL